MKSSKSNTHAKSSSSSLVLLFRLIEANDWGKLMNMFLSDHEGREMFQYLATLVAKSSSFNGMTILHACARFNPPAVVVHRIIELCPRAAKTRDCLDRTPLHVAAGCCASTAAMKVLVDAYPEACLVQDKDGRTPLHMACDSSCQLFDYERRETERPPPCHRTIGVLLSAKLSSAILEDDDGMSAIEYALCSDADLKTVRLIQKAAQRVHRKRNEVEKGESTCVRFTQKVPSPSTKHFSPRGLLSAPIA